MLNEYPPLFMHLTRLYNSHIINPSGSFETVASTLFGVQSQIFNASAVAFALRTHGLSLSRLIHELDALHLVRLWGIRTALHIYHRDDWECLLSQLSTTSNWYSSKMKAKGIDVNHIMKKVLNIIRDVDYFDRELLINGGIKKEHLGPWGDLLIELNNKGYIFSRTYSPNRSRLFGNTQVIFGRKIQYTKQSDDTRKKLALRFFRAYAPASFRDLAHWLGIAGYKSQEYLALIEDELMPIRCGNEEYYIEAIKQKTFEKIFHLYADTSDYQLLSKFDPLLLAYHDKKWIADKPCHHRIWKIAGHIEGVVLQGGKAIATWRYILKSKAINFEVSPFYSRFSVRKMEKSCQKIACFFELPIGMITISENL